MSWITEFFCHFKSSTEIKFNVSPSPEESQTIKMLLISRKQTWSDGSQTHSTS